jgi:AcrR family transcriptional regulator
MRTRTQTTSMGGGMGSEWSRAQPSRPRRAGRPARLSREEIVSAARSIVEAEGFDSLTMRRVALELDRSPMAIYRHVRDKDQLLVSLLDRLAAEITRPRLPRDPRKRLEKACVVMRDSLAQHAWVIDVLAQGDLIAPSILWLLEEIVAGFVACGLSHRQAADGYRAVWQLTVGDLIVRRGLDHVAALGRPPYVLEVLASVEEKSHPTLAALAPHWQSSRTTDTYQLGIAALLDGLIANARRSV